MSERLQNFGKQVRQLRKKANLTQEKLAEAAGISAYYAGQIERGEGLPSLRTADNLAQAFGMTLSDLFRFPSEQETPQEILNKLIQQLEDASPTSVEDLNLLGAIVTKITAR